MEAVKAALAACGIDSQRFDIAWVSAAEAAKFAEIVTEFTDKIQKLGPNPLYEAGQIDEPVDGQEAGNGQSD